MKRRRSTHRTRSDLPVCATEHSRFQHDARHWCGCGCLHCVRAYVLRTDGVDSEPVSDDEFDGCCERTRGAIEEQEGQ